jgi:hypothetical protein
MYKISPERSWRMPAAFAVPAWMTCVMQQAAAAVTPIRSARALPTPAETVPTCHQTLGMSEKLRYGEKKKEKHLLQVYIVKMKKKNPSID